MTKLSEAVQDIGTMKTDIALIKQAVLGNGEIEGICGTVKRHAEQIDKHEGYFKKASGGAFVIGLFLSYWKVFHGGH